MGIQRVSAKNKEQIIDHIRRLPVEDCYMRFGQTMTPSAITNYVEKINFNRDMAFAIFSPTVEGEILAFAHIAFYSEAEWPVAELGLSVSPELRNMGMGKTIIEHSINLAKIRGAKNLYVQTMTGNRPMYRLMQKFNAHMTVDDLDATISFPLNELENHERISTKIINDCEAFEKIPSKTPKSIIIFVHGAGGDGWQFRRYFMPYFSKENVYTLALSLPNHGESKNSSWEIDEYIKTIKLAHEHALSHNFNVPVMIVGHSMGGWLVQKYASEATLPLSAIALLASVPPYNPHSLSENFLPLVQGQLHSMLAKNSLEKIMYKASPIDVEKITVPVFCISGDKDTVILPEWNKKTSFHYRAPLYSIDSGHNVMTGPTWEECARIIKDNIQYKDAQPVNAEVNLDEDGILNSSLTPSSKNKSVLK